MGTRGLPAASAAFPCVLCKQDTGACPPSAPRVPLELGAWVQVGRRPPGHVPMVAVTTTDAWPRCHRREGDACQRQEPLQCRLPRERPDLSCKEKYLG